MRRRGRYQGRSLRASGFESIVRQANEQLWSRSSRARPRLPEWARKSRDAFRIAEQLEARAAGLESAHGLRIGALPEHPRVLPSRRGDVHDSGQLLHARLRLLLGAEGQSAEARTCALDPAEPANVARMAAEMKLRYVVITSVNRDDLRGRRLAPFRRDRARGAAGAAGGARGSADAGFLRRSRGSGARAGCRAARLQSQHGDGAAAVPRVRPQADYRQSLDVLQFARRYRPDVLTKSGFMVGLGETRGRSASAAARPARRGHGRGDHRPVSAAHAPQLPVARVRDARRSSTRIATSGSRSASRWCSAGRWCAVRTWRTIVNERGPAARRELAAGAASAALLISRVSRIQSRLAGARCADSAAGRGAREQRLAAALPAGVRPGIVYWFGVCYWIQFVLATFTAAWATLRPGSCSCCSAWPRRLHMGVFALLAGWTMRRWWAIPAVAALWVADRVHARAAGLRVAGLGNAAIDMALPLRLAPFTACRASRSCSRMMAAALAPGVAAPADPAAVAGLLPLLLRCFPRCRRQSRRSERAVLVQPNISETEAVDSAELRRCCCSGMDELSSQRAARRRAAVPI